MILSTSVFAIISSGLGVVYLEDAWTVGYGAIVGGLIGYYMTQWNDHGKRFIFYVYFSVFYVK